MWAIVLCAGWGFLNLSPAGIALMLLMSVCLGLMDAARHL
jgi:hypothetical protein